MTPTVTVNFGTRFDAYSYTIAENQVSPRINVVWQPNDWLTAHAGYSFGDYWDLLKKQGAGRSYLDYAVGVGYTAGKFSFAAKWIDGSDLKELDGTPGNVFSSGSRVVLSVATTFPWGE